MDKEISEMTDYEVQQYLNQTSGPDCEIDEYLKLVQKILDIDELDLAPLDFPVWDYTNNKISRPKEYPGSLRGDDENKLLATIQQYLPGTTDYVWAEKSITERLGVLRLVVVQIKVPDTVEAALERGYLPFSDLLKDGFGSDAQATRFIKNPLNQIRHLSFGQRLYVHGGDWSKNGLRLRDKEKEPSQAEQDGIQKRIQEVKQRDKH